MRRAFSVLATMAACACVAASIIALSPYPLTPLMAAVQASIPLLVLFCAAGVGVALIARQRTATIVCVASLGVLAALGAEVRLASQLEPTSPMAITVVSANVLYTNETSAAAVDDLLALQPDILVTVETSDSVYAELSGRYTPRPAARGGGVASGVVIWSSLPTRALPDLVLPGRSLPVVRVDLPTGPTTVIGVHLSSPTTSESLQRWRREWTALHPQLMSIEGPVVVLGDFNTSHAHAPMRKVLSRYESVSMGSLSSGTASTWPARPYHWWPFAFPVLDIDHVLVDDLGADSFRRFSITGSDHLGVVARVG